MQIALDVHTHTIVSGHAFSVSMGERPFCTVATEAPCIIIT